MCNSRHGFRVGLFLSLHNGVGEDWDLSLSPLNQTFIFTYVTRTIESETLSQVPELQGTTEMCWTVIHTCVSQTLLLMRPSCSCSEKDPKWKNPWDEPHLGLFTPILVCVLFLGCCGLEGTLSDHSLQELPSQGLSPGETCPSRAVQPCATGHVVSPVPGHSAVVLRTESRTGCSPGSG